MKSTLLLKDSIPKMCKATDFYKDETDGEPGGN